MYKSSNKFKIFVSAYACEPNLGSEIGVGWHWVIEMSKYFDLWVLTRQSNKESIENWQLENPVPNKINFVYYDLPKKLRFWKKGMRGVRTYYVLWQKLTNKIVKQVMEDNGIEIFHLLTYGNALWPISKYGQEKFFIWGPTGAGDIIPEEFSKHYSRKGQIIEKLRRLSKSTLPLNTGFKRRCSNANLIFCKTQTALNSIPEEYRNKAIVFTDVAVDPVEILDILPKSTCSDQILKYLAVGRLDAWRGFDLLIEAFAKAAKINTNIRLEILGKGSDKSRLQGLIAKHRMESTIALGGQVSMSEYYQKMAASDVVVNPALKEGAVTTAFDSMSLGKPLICIETGGYTRYFNNEYAVVIPLNSRKEVISNLSKGILQLTDTDLRLEKGLTAREKGKQFNWETKGQQIQKAIKNSYIQVAT
jgi:glycosyltransferase involved in cell wall biosynthesis